MAWQFWHWVVFQNLLWLLVLSGTWISSVVLLARSRLRHWGATIVCLLGLMVIGASLVTCLVEPALERYSYPTQFIYYLLLALVPLLGMPAAPSGRAADSSAR